MRAFGLFTRAVFGFIAAALMLLAIGLILYAGSRFVGAFRAEDADLGRAMLEAVGYMVIAIAVFEVAKYIFEEEAIDPAEMRHTGEARRSITKFVSTITIAIFLEALLSVFESSKGTDLRQMIYPTFLLLAGVALIIGLGVYQRLSVSAEQVIANDPGVESEEEADKTS